MSTPIEENNCYRVEVGFKDMDMSGGDVVDGPRWTGKWLDATAVFHVVAPTRLLAEAGAVALCYEHEKPAVKSARKVCEVNLVLSAATK